jgi:hypothetical protein
MLTWDELINKFTVLREGSQGYKRSKLASCMLEMLPSLRQAVEMHLPDTRLALVMLAVELRVPGASQAVVIQCVDECRFVLRVKNNRYEVLEEKEVDMSNVVKQTMQYLEMSRED